MSRKPMLVLSAGLLLAGVAHAGATVSKHQKETKRGANYWAGNAALDGKDETCWMLPGDSQNVDEYLILDVPRINIDKLSMKVGWEKDDESFKDYARVKKVTIEASYYDATNELVSSPTIVEAEFKDERGWQTVDLQDINVPDAENGGKIKITIKEVYPGADFPQLAVSDLYVHLGEFDAAVQFAEISSEEGKANLTDGNAKTAWNAPASGAGFTLQGGGVMLSSIDLTPGPATHARPKTIKMTVKNREETVELPNTAGPHHIILPPTVGYTGSWDPVKVEIVDVWPGKSAPDTLSIAEIKGHGTALDGL